ncbi:MAG TPA: 30S ribosome-binding factor RbfA, partial [Thermoanaerobaculia bacterium]|nr:30S ribosome-binding factor RbfA [Thermoanaerobaculia bacterium]
MSHRPERVADLLRAEISAILARELSDPRVRLVTVSQVEVSSDLRHAKVKLSILGNEAERQAALEGARHARGFIRRQLGSRLSLRLVPELTFELDRGAEHSQRISDLLEELER